MKATFKMEPFPHVLLDDYFEQDEWNTCMAEIAELNNHLLPPEFTGTARDHATGRPTKFNSGLFLSLVYPKCQIIKMARHHMYQSIVNQIDCKWWTDQWKVNQKETWLLSRYIDGQYYNAHIDFAPFTMLLWLHELPKPFTGGDLLFRDFDNYSVPCNNNTGIIFYGPMRHEVPPIKGSGRYTITCFTGLEFK